MSTPFEITGPGFYHQRDGRKAEICWCIVSPNSVYAWKGYSGNGELDTWTINGRHSSSSYDSYLDLVAHWVEEPVKTACSACEDEAKGSFANSQHRCEASLETFDIVEREVVLRRFSDGEYQAKDVSADIAQNCSPLARATVTFKVPKPAEDEEFDIVERTVVLYRDTRQNTFTHDPNWSATEGKGHYVIAATEQVKFKVPKPKPKTAVRHDMCDKSQTTYTERRAYREQQQVKAARIGFANTAMRALIAGGYSFLESEKLATTAVEFADAMVLALGLESKL